MNRIWKLFCLCLVVSACAFATTTGLPWEAPMATVESSITGTTAVSLGGLVLAGTGCVYAFHGEIMEFIRKASGAVIALGLGLAAVAAVTTLFAATGATV